MKQRVLLLHSITSVSVVSLLFPLYLLVWRFIVWPFATLKLTYLKQDVFQSSKIRPYMKTAKDNE